jgi:hypothetical protein
MENDYCRDARSGRPPAGGGIIVFIRMGFRWRGPMRAADAQTGRPYSVDKQLIV